ncbi:unnamed protein product [Effrenium voratum]|nr:unnamed protein product [Effrenium voratum]
MTPRDGGEELSWEDIGVVTIQDRLPQPEVPLEESSSSSTSESEIGEEWLNLAQGDKECAGDNEPLIFDDLFPAVAESEIELPSVAEVEEQLAAVRRRRARVAEIAERYGGAAGDAAKAPAAERLSAQGARCAGPGVALPATGGYGPGHGSEREVEASKAPGLGPCLASEPAIPGGLRSSELLLERLRRDLTMDRERSEELWRGFLCDDLPVGGDMLPSPDEFYKASS